MNQELDKQRLIKHLQEDIYCRIGVTSTHGVGVIAIRDIPKNTNPFNNLSTYKKEKIINLTEDDLKNVNKNVRKILGDFFDGAGSGSYSVLYDGPNYMNITFYMNHSANPNIIPVNIPELSKYYSFITLRDIKEGEELTFDYTKFTKNGVINNSDINKKLIGGYSGYNDSKNNLIYYKFNKLF
jgi:SET domain-containing protein